MEYYLVPSRQLPISYAKSLVPALVLGFLLPTIALYLPFDDPGFTLKQALVAFWQPTPLYVNLLLLLLSPLLDAFAPSATSEKADGDAAYVRLLYIICFFVSAAAHCGTMVLFARDTKISFARTFLPHTELLPYSAAETLHFIFQWDYLIIFGASLLWACVAVHDLHSMESADISLAIMGLMIVAGSIVCGPAATVVGAFWWREGRMRDGGKKKVL